MTVQYQGVWSLQSAAQLQSTQRWVTDPLMENTTLLLQADDAANAAQNNTFLDSSSNSFAITRNGNTTQGSFTPFSAQPGAWSNFFGGSTDYIAFTSIAAYGVGTGNFSVQTFVNFNSISGNQRIFCLGASGTDGINVQFAGSTTQLQLDIANTRIITHTWTPVVGTWYQIDVVRAGTGTNQTTLYINGLSVATGTSSGSVGQNAANIGGLSWNSSFTVNGYVSNVRFSNTARSISAVTTNYSSDANTLLLTAQSNRFVDNSSTGNTFTIGGTPSVQAFSPFAPQFQWTPSVIGGSGYFDGTGDYLSVADNTALDMGSSDFTIEFWTYLVGTPSTYQAYFAKRANTGTYGGVELYLTSGRTLNLQATLNGSSWGVDITTTSTVPFNTWTHIAAVRNGNTWVVYVNGTAGATSGTVSGTVPDNANTFVIGAGASDGSHVMVASYISNFRVVKGTAVYTGAFTPPIAPVTTSGPASSYSSTTNVNTTFTSTNTSLLTNFTNAGIYDATMKNNLETVADARVSTAVVKYGSGSMFFDGTGDYLFLPSRPLQALLTSDFTIEFWFNSSSIAQYAGIVDMRNPDTANAGWNVLFYEFKISFGTAGTIYIAGVTPLVANRWYHYALTRSGNIFKQYLDGVQEGTTYTGSSTQNFTNTIMQIGAGASGAYTGYIDDLRITRGIARYTQNFIPPSVALPRQ